VQLVELFHVVEAEVELLGIDVCKNPGMQRALLRQLTCRPCPCPSASWSLKVYCNKSNRKQSVATTTNADGHGIHDVDVMSMSYQCLVDVMSISCLLT